MWGNFDLAKQNMKDADETLSNLKRENPFLRDPLDKLTDEAKEQNLSLKRIISEGVSIKQPED